MSAQSVTQCYVSDELTHFVGGGGKSEEEQFGLLLKILREGELRVRWKTQITPTSYTVIDAAHTLSSNEKYVPECVCFCDIPLETMSIHTTKYGRTGLSFAKDFLVKQGASPVYYVPVTAPAPPPGTRALYFDVADAAITEIVNAGSPTSRQKVLWDFLVHYVFTHVKFFDHTKPDNDPDNYYMEREWRVLGGIRFGLNDIRRILIPNEYQSRLHDALPEYDGLITCLQ